MVCYLEVLQLVRQHNGPVHPKEIRDTYGLDWWKALMVNKDHDYLRWEDNTDLESEYNYNVFLNEKGWNWLDKHDTDNFCNNDVARKKEEKLGRKLRWRDE